MCQPIHILFAIKFTLWYALVLVNFRICIIFLLELDLQRAVLNLFFLDLLQNQASKLISLKPLAWQLCPLYRDVLELVISRSLLGGGVALF